MMKTMLMLILVVLSIRALANEAGEYWIVAELDSSTEAVEQGEKISGLTGVEVLLRSVDAGDTPAYQLLVRQFEDEYDRSRLRSQLRYAGLDTESTTTLAGNERDVQSLFAVMDTTGNVMGSSIDSGPVEDLGLPLEDGQESWHGGLSGRAGDYLVCGSFRNESQAEGLRRKLLGSFDEVWILEAVIDGNRYHRVVVGPVSAPGEESMKQRLGQEGIEHPWMLRGVAVESPAVKPAPLPSTVDDVVTRTPPVVRKTVRMSTNPVNDPYNPAKLRTVPDPFHLKKR